MKRTIIYTAVYLISCYFIYGQRYINEEYVQKTPEVMSIERFGECLVNEYNGIPQIKIPLHTIKSKDINMPISLDYHASGIQVDQEATWVGLGWNLMAGGCISYIPVGKIDFQITPSFTDIYDWDKFYNYVSKLNTENPAPNQYPLLFKQNSVLPDGTALPTDQMNITREMINEALCGNSEADLYNVFFLGQSLKFHLKNPHVNEFVYNGEKGNYIISYSHEGRHIVAWTIKDDKGFEYNFEDYETYVSAGETKELRSWYLSNIKYNNDEILRFNYTQRWVKLLPYIVEQRNVDFLVSSTITRDSKIQRTVSENFHTTQLYLSDIVGKIDSISFKTKPRVDIRNGVALDEIVVANRFTKEIIKKYKLEHDYFVGSDVASAASNEDYVKKRLKLTKLKEFGNEESRQYEFKYEETNPLPYKTSFARDLWGYYNGRKGDIIDPAWIDKSKINPDYSNLYAINRTLIPTQYMFMEELDSDELTKYNTGQFKGADRSVNADYITTGVLNSIIYPTGGRTDFEYESHSFDNRKYTLTNTKKVTHDVFHNNSRYLPDMAKTFTLQNPTDALIRVSFKGNNFEELSSAGHVKLILNIDSPDSTITYYALQQSDKTIYENNNNSFIREKNLILPAGTHRLVAYINSSIIPIQENYTYNYVVSANLSYSMLIHDVDSSKEYIGGGIRIKSIKNYTDNNILANVRKYSYNFDNGNTSGKLIFPLKFLKSRKCVETKGEPYYYHLNRSEMSSSNKYNYVAIGLQNSIGYSNVTIEEIDCQSQKENGKIILNFINNPSESYSDYFFFPLRTADSDNIFSNGKLSSKIILSENNDTVYVERNQYALNALDYNFCNLYVYDNFIGDFTGPCGAGGHYDAGKRFTMIAYPTISYRCVLENRETISCFQGKKLYEKSNYEYDNNTHLVKKITTDLGYKVNRVEYKYPIDFSNKEPYLSMVNKNILASVVEETEYTGEAFLRKRIYEYKKWNENLYEIEFVKSQNSGQQNPEIRTIYHNYDINRNPIYISKNKGSENIIYLWGYNAHYLMAEIKGITYNEYINTTSGSAYRYMLMNLELPPDDTRCIAAKDQLRNAFPQAQVTTYTYKPLVGMTSMTNPRGVTTYYEYDSFGRLKETYIMEDGVKQVLQAYHYHYSNR